MHYMWMRRAVDLAKASVAESGRIDPPPAVGAVIVKNGVEAASASRGQCGSGNHAEYCALSTLEIGSVEGAIVYTTLEPCSRRNTPKICCAQRLIDSKVAAVFIGMYDPNPKIYREGWRMLRDAGVALFDFPGDLRSELRQLNQAFVDQYRAALVPAGDAVFDYVQNGTFTIGQAPDSVETRWSKAASGVVHAYSDLGHIALARHAHLLNEVDDPAAMDFKPEVHSVTANAGDVVVFRGINEKTYGIVRVNEVLCPPKDDRSELSITFEVRKSGSRADQ